MTKPTIITHPFPAESAHKRLIALRFWLQGAKYHDALLGLDYNLNLFKGELRKDGSNAFDHHVFQANFIRCFNDILMFPEETITLSFFHDTHEDKSVSYSEVRDLYAHNPIFGGRVAEAAKLVTKTFRGVKVENEKQLFVEMGENPISSVLKGVDRIHNHQSMFAIVENTGKPAFTYEKQASYLRETEELILPMLKRAEMKFAAQEPVYKHIRTVLKMQVQLIRHHLDYVDSMKKA